MIMGDGTVYNVDLASDIKAWVDNARFADPSVRDRIMNANDDSVLRVGFTIGSPITILTVDTVDAAFFKAHLFADGEQRGV